MLKFPIFEVDVFLAEQGPLLRPRLFQLFILRRRPRGRLRIRFSAAVRRQLHWLVFIVGLLALE